MNTSEFISSLKLHGSFPTSDDLFSDADFLSLLNHQMLADLLPMMMKLNEEFFIFTKDFTISQGSTYRVPTRAVGSIFRSLHVVDASSNYTSLVRLYEEDRPLSKSGYYLQRNSVELSSDFTSNTLRMKIFARPSKLVLTTDCAQITSIDSATQVTVSATPSTITTGTLIDFVQNKNPYDLLGYDTATTLVSGTTITFASLPTDLAVGDWICLPSEAPVLMFPEELHPVLVQSSLCKTLSSKKDKQYKDELETLMRVKEDAINMLDPRVQDNSNKVRTGKLIGYFSSGR